MLLFNLREIRYQIRSMSTGPIYPHNLPVSKTTWRKPRLFVDFCWLSVACFDFGLAVLGVSLVLYLIVLYFPLIIMLMFIEYYWKRVLVVRNNLILGDIVIISVNSQFTIWTILYL